MIGWFKHFARENHADERMAARWHVAHAVTYGVLIVLYAGSIAWHVIAASRHRAAAQKLPSARAGNGVWDEADPDGA